MASRKKQEVEPRKKSKPSDTPLNFKQVENLFHAADTFRNRCIMETFFWLALRRAEAANWMIENIDFKNEQTVIIGKGNKERVLPFIDRQHMSDIKHLIGSRRSGYVFLSYQNKGMSLRSFNKVTAKVGKLAGIEQPHDGYVNINPHILRHSLNPWLRINEFSDKFRQRFFGHKSIVTTQDEYGDMTPPEMHNEIERRLGD